MSNLFISMIPFYLRREWTLKYFFLHTYKKHGHKNYINIPNEQNDLFTAFFYSKLYDTPQYIQMKSFGCFFQCGVNWSRNEKG